jgi:hypothetical protein
MKTLHTVVLTLAIGTAAAAQAQQQESIVIVGTPVVIDASYLVGEDSGSFYLSRQLTTSTRQRADVVATMAQPEARREAAALVGEDSGSMYYASLPLGPGVDRAVVVAELDRARASGELGALVGEDSGSAWLSHHMSATATASTAQPSIGHQAAATASQAGVH